MRNSRRKEREMLKDVKTKFEEMNDDELSLALFDYSKVRTGEIAEITYAGSIRIAVLSARVKELEKRMGDDGK